MSLVHKPVPFTIDVNMPDGTPMHIRLNDGSTGGQISYDKNPRPLAEAYRVPSLRFQRGLERSNSVWRDRSGHAAEICTQEVVPRYEKSPWDRILGAMNEEEILSI